MNTRLTIWHTGSELDSWSKINIPYEILSSYVSKDCKATKLSGIYYGVIPLNDYQKQCVKEINKQIKENRLVLNWGNYYEHS